MLIGSAVALALFVRQEARASTPMMPLDLWRNRDFTVLGVMTFLLYGVLGGWLFLLAIVLQRTMGYSALEAGLALFPLTVSLALLSSRVGRLMPRVGGARMLVLGSTMCGIALLLQLLVRPGASYWLEVFPGVALYSLGFVLIVVPITSMTLAAAPVTRSGIASGVSNANARVASLIAVAGLPLLVGISTTSFPPDDVLVDGFARAMVICAALCLIAALLGQRSLSRPSAGR
jgi:hypothetical protein